MQQHTTALVALLLAALAAAAAAQTNHDSCVHRVQACDPAVDYFPTKVSFDHSTSVSSLNYSNTHVTIKQEWSAWSGSHTQNIVLVRCGCPSPNLGDDYVEVHVPVSSISVHETVAIPKVYMLGQRAKLIAVDSVQYATTKELISDVEEGSTLDIAGNFTRMVAAGKVPDVLLTGSGSLARATGYAAHPVFAERRILDADAGETTPLGRAELLKLAGLLFGAEDTANAVFDMVTFRYEDAKERAAVARRRPSVMVNMWSGWTGNWSVTAGSSYVGQYLKDANAEYANEDDSLPRSLGVDEYMRHFERADYWLNAAVYGGRTTMDAILNRNASKSATGDRPWLARFSAVKCGEVYANDNLVGNRAGNPFYELGVLRPDLVLDDLVRILHPDAAAAGSLNFYQRVAPPANATGIGACPRVYFAPAPPAGKVYVTALYRVAGQITTHAFLDSVHDGLKDRVAGYLQVDASELELVLSSVPPPSAGSFTVRVTARRDACRSAVKGDCAGVLGVGRLLRDGEAAMASLLQAALDSSSANVTAVRDKSVEVSTAESEVIPLASLEPEASDDDGLSGGQVTAIAVAAAALFVLAAVAVAVVHKRSFKKGEAAAYSALAASAGDVSLKDAGPAAAADAGATAAV